MRDGTHAITNVQKTTAIHIRAPSLLRLMRCGQEDSDLDPWAWQDGVVLDCSWPGNTTDKALAEGFNSRARQECSKPILSS